MFKYLYIHISSIIIKWIFLFVTVSSASRPHRFMPQLPYNITSVTFLPPPPLPEVLADIHKRRDGIIPRDFGTSFTSLHKRDDEIIHQMTLDTAWDDAIKFAERRSP